MNSFKVLYFLFVLALFSQCTTVNSSSSTQTNTQIIPTYPQSISFAGEVVPLDKHYVLERLDRELLVNNFWHSNSILVLKRATKYFPIIEPILQENGIPDDFKYAFEKCDLILTPTTPNVAFPIGEKQSDPLEMYLNDVLTVPASLAGLPAISVSAGNNNKNLPIGMQIIGRPFEEISVLAAGSAIELSKV